MVERFAHPPFSCSQHSQVDMADKHVLQCPACSRIFANRRLLLDHTEFRSAGDKDCGGHVHLSESREQGERMVRRRGQCTGLRRLPGAVPHVNGSMLLQVVRPACDRPRQRRDMETCQGRCRRLLCSACRDVRCPWCRERFCPWCQFPGGHACPEMPWRDVDGARLGCYDKKRTWQRRELKEGTHQCCKAGVEAAAEAAVLKTMEKSGSVQENRET